MKLLKEEKGITLIALVITIIVLLIVAGVSIIKGTDLVSTSKAETVETDMLTIKAKAKEYMENVDSKNWASSDSDASSNESGLSTKEEKNRAELTGDKYQLILIEDINSYNNNDKWYEDGYTYYEIGTEALKKMNLPDSLNENSKLYIIRYPLEDGNTSGLKMDIIYANGIGYKDVIYYELSELEKVL